MIILLVVAAVIIVVLFCNSTPIFHRENGELLIEESPVISGGEEFKSIRGNKKAVLFIHGFPGSPKMFYLIRDLAVKDGYDVFSPRLPGFGTSEKDFIQTNFTMWYNYIRDYYLGIRGNYNEFYIVGNSMGGALTLKLAEEFTKDSLNAPTAISVTAAPVFINNYFRGVNKDGRLVFIRMISWFTKYIKPRKERKSAEFDQDGDTEWIGYRGLFPKQTYSLMMGLKRIKKELNRVDLPCYLCQAREDKTVPFENLYYIANKISSDDILLRVMNLKDWKHTNHSLFIYKSIGPKLWREIDEFFKDVAD